MHYAKSNNNNYKKKQKKYSYYISRRSPPCVSVCVCSFVHLCKCVKGEEKLSPPPLSPNSPDFPPNQRKKVPLDGVLLAVAIFVCLHVVVALRWLSTCRRSPTTKKVPSGGVVRLNFINCRPANCFREVCGRYFERFFLVE